MRKRLFRHRRRAEPYAAAQSDAGPNRCADAHSVTTGVGNAIGNPVAFTIIVGGGGLALALAVEFFRPPVRGQALRPFHDERTPI